jgi:hypothetical protein
VGGCANGQQKRNAQFFFISVDGAMEFFEIKNKQLRG